MPSVLQALHHAIVFGLHVERRFEPFFRPAVDAVLREPLANGIQYLINRNRRDEGLKLAEEQVLPGEEQALQVIIDTMSEYMRQHWQPGDYQRAGNTKTHGVVRGTVTIRDDLPQHMRQGVFAEPRSYQAWVRFSGPGPDRPTDIDDVGFVSIGIKLMGVPGPKLLDDEILTQDFLAICTPTFVTPTVVANAKLQQWILKGTPLFYFADPRDSHMLDGLMQSLWNKTQSNPLGERYWSCVPYLLGEGQAMMYSVYPRSQVYRKIPRLPLRPPDNYLRDNMVKTLAEQDVEFDIMLHSTCRSRMQRSAGRRSFRPSFPRRGCTSRSRNSIRLVSVPSPTTCHTTPGTVCRSIALWATRVARGAGCIGNCRSSVSG
jgi:hypothetical protein